jgi:hypothetical protein
MLSDHVVAYVSIEFLVPYESASTSAEAATLEIAYNSALRRPLVSAVTSDSLNSVPMRRVHA